MVSLQSVNVSGNGPDSLLVEDSDADVGLVKFPLEPLNLRLVEQFRLLNTINGLGCRSYAPLFEHPILLAKVGCCVRCILVALAQKFDVIL